MNISHSCIVYLWERIRSQSLRWVPSLLFCVDVFGYHKLTIKRWNLYLLSIVNFFLKRTKWLCHLSIPDFQEVCTSFQLKLWYFLTTVTSCCYFFLFVSILVEILFVFQNLSCLTNLKLLSIQVSGVRVKKKLGCICIVQLL